MKNPNIPNLVASLIMSSATAPVAILSKKYYNYISHSCYKITSWLKRPEMIHTKEQISCDNEQTNYLQVFLNNFLTMERRLTGE